MTQCIPSEDYIHWIHFIFGDCVYSTQEAISVLLGYASIFFWLNAQIPQVIENYKVGSAESLSINFLSIWLAGDAANLIGCILTGQLPFQRYLGFYFVSIDICLLCQWIYYNSRDKRRRNKHRLSTNKQSPHRDALSKVFQHPSVRTPLLIEGQQTPPIKTLDDELAPYSASSSPSKWYTLNNTDDKTKKTVLMALFLFGTRLPVSSLVSSSSASQEDWLTLVADNTLIIGRFFAWICTALYLLSRIPQIVKNYRRRSIDGLSPALFAFAASGNLTYTSSILLNPNNTRESLLEAVPYLIGSAGTLTFDFTIFCQFLYYWRQKRKQQERHYQQDHVA
ncbi:hypothetical protein K492DRAFT_202827 [Lichtheimia hyalospora FSU 10163]|nr:hypothetical protein K492DRAFT_202827 [Lichtheimia hyalospora FSU 10163]